MCATCYASQDSEEGVRRYGTPLNDVQWIERVRHYTVEYYNERDNFEVLHLEDRPFSDAIITAAADRANIPMRPDPLEVLRRDQAKACNDRFSHLENSLQDLCRDFRSFKNDEALRIEEGLTKILSRVRKRKAPVAVPPPPIPTPPSSPLPPSPPSALLPPPIPARPPPSSIPDFLATVAQSESEEEQVDYEEGPLDLECANDVRPHRGDDEDG
jgi:hypothetical protein